MDVKARASGTVGNFGPAFDSASLALGPLGDEVRLREAGADEIRVEGFDVPPAWSANAAGAVIDHLRAATGQKATLRLDLRKGVPPGSGLGSSASSCAASALAFAQAFGPLPRSLLLQAAVAGEERVAGPHRDDVGAALFGGLVLVDPDGWEPRALPPPRALRLAVLRPHVSLETRRMRGVLPASVPRGDAVQNLQRTAALVAAFLSDDVPAVGAAMHDRIATPARSPLVPGWTEARQAALAAGAHGFALSGSGPAMFAVAEGDAQARTLAAAMREAVEAAKIEASAFVGVPEEVRNLGALLR